jgi:GT2 family glycosyltransferase
VEKTWGPLRWVPLDWCEKIPLMCRVPSLPLARNILAKHALDAGATHLFWLDSDLVFEKPEDPNEALRLLYLCDAPIVAGLYRAKQKVGFNYAAWVKVEGGYAPIREWSGNYIRVDVTGLGCCLVKREVFEKVPKPWFKWVEEEAPSEDFAFFEKCREAGYEVRIFTEVRLSHIGALKVLSDGSVSTLDV